MAMKVVVYGATGKTGSRVITELLRRGHAVVGISRAASKMAAQPGLSTVDDDMSSADKMAEAFHRSFGLLMRM